MESKIKELAAADVLTSAYLMLQDCRKLKTSLAMELQVARTDRVEFKNLMHEFRVTLDQIQVQFAIERRLLDLIRPESGRQTDEKRRLRTNTQ